jgi:hypothetical protein
MDLPNRFRWKSKIPAEGEGDPFHSLSKLRRREHPGPTVSSGMTRPPRATLSSDSKRNIKRSLFAAVRRIFWSRIAQEYRAAQSPSHLRFARCGLFPLGRVGCQLVTSLYTFETKGRDYGANSTVPGVRLPTVDAKGREDRIQADQY